MYTSEFWKDAGERATKTAAQALVALFVAGVTIMSVDWVEALAIAGTAALVSVLTSVASAGRGNHDSASALKHVGKPSVVAPSGKDSLPAYDGPTSTPDPYVGEHRLDG